MKISLEDLKGKKLLILSGVGAHIKVVETAKQMGIHTIVVDYLEPSMASPAKIIADEQWMESILDTDSIVDRCRKEQVDGVISYCSDIAQKSYCKICTELGVPCYGNKELFLNMSNKRLFKNMCVHYGLNVIEEYSTEDVEKSIIKFPVFVKPVDGKGSKGQSICNNYDELKAAIRLAENVSLSKDILIERYIANKNSFQATYFFVDGEAYLIRTADGYKGAVERGLDRVALCSISPSIYTKEFMEGDNDRFIDMLKSYGYKDGPAMVQGFYENGVFRFYDPGLRFPGTDFELVYKKIFGEDLIEAMIYFSLTGIMPKMNLSNAYVNLNGKKVAVLYPTLRAGEVASIAGIDELKHNEKVISYSSRYQPGDSVEFTNTTRQRLAEIDILGENYLDLASAIKKIQESINVADMDGNNMMYCPFDIKRMPND